MENKKISIIAVNWWAEDFGRLLQKTALEKTKNDFELIIIDNSKSWKGQASYLKVLSPENNLGHGLGLDRGIAEADGEYILILDIDTHILLKNWDELFIQEFESNPKIKLMAASDGGLLKPARPLAMFFKKETIIKNRISFKAINLAGIKLDVGLYAYFRILTEYGDQSVKRLPAGKTDYKEVLGNEYCYNGRPFVYHNWYGTRWYNVNGERVHDKIDRVEWEYFKKCKENLFKQINADI